MRTTLTLDDDVAAMLKQLQEKENLSLKELVNKGLRMGLYQLRNPPKPREPFRTQSVDLGECLIGNVDNIGEVLAYAEGEFYR